MTIYFITADALKHGIRQLKCREDAATWWGKTVVGEAGGTSGYVVGRDAFDNLPDAIADAEQRRAKQIAKLQDRIAKLEKLEFGA